ncbi:MAG: hypothetical protein JW849_09285 [Phycisphaerae bacterium]|nr:hypothetical protein [Phycisphaerae bacterium]
MDTPMFNDTTNKNETDRNLELFLDDELLSWEYNLARTLCQPTKHPANPILQPEQPWEETAITLYGSVLPREEGGFAMWYMALASGWRSDQMMCLAESADGVAWTRAIQQGLPYRNCAESNVVLGPEPNVHGPCVLRNEHNDDPSERYLVLFDSYTRYRPQSAEARRHDRCCYTAVSPDGVHWTPKEGRLAIPSKSDTGQGVVWDPLSRRHIAYLRGTRAVHDPFGRPYGESQRVRYVRAATSADFLHWSDPIELLRADIIDGDPDHQFHQLSVTRRGNQFVALLSIFHITGFEKMRSADEGGREILMEQGSCDTQLAVSRDGLHWRRVANRAVFLPLGLPGTWDSRWLTTAGQLVTTDAETLLYYGGAGTERGEGHKTCLGLATLPRDRFQALQPRRLGQPGVVETKPLRINPTGELYVNADAQKGRLVVEVCDFMGKTIEGFALDDCDAITTDSLDAPVRWRGKPIGQAVRDENPGKDIRIRFYLHQASLYAAKIPCSPFWDILNG